jgi:peptide/nickel transport system permease protein
VSEAPDAQLLVPKVPIGAADAPPVEAPIGSGAHPILRFVARRLAIGILTLLVVSALVFIATNALPGNVAQVVLGRNATPAHVAALDHTLGLDKPLVTRYLSWLGNAARGNLGTSAVQAAQGTDAPVTGVLAAPVRNSLVLAVTTAILLFPLSLLVGTFVALRAGRPDAYAVSYVTLVLNALPEFVFGTILIFIFFSGLDLLPPVDLVPPGTTPFDDINALVLPVVTLLGVTTAFSARLIRSGMLDALQSPYVTAARLNGIRERRVVWRYALRNALAPSVQAFAQSLQYLFGGIIVVEALFSYPGVGNLLVQAVSERDITEVQAISLVLAAVYIAINIAADLIAVLLVPKLRTGMQ